MYIDSYMQEPRTAGISIFHDGLPKLATVHCYDRGNIATFGLQSCQPRPAKDPPKLYPIRPIVNHVTPKGPYINQPRMYSGPQRPLINQPKMYSGAFYPPGNQPRVQRIDGRPVFLPSTFNNTFIHQERFDPTINKSNSVVYNGPYPPPPNCCMQYASLDHCRPFSDDIVKPPPNLIRPDIPNPMPYTTHVDMMRQRMNNAACNDIRNRDYCDGLQESLIHPRKMDLNSLNSDNPSMHCNSGNPPPPVPCIPQSPTMLCESGNVPIGCKPGNPNIACKFPVVIDLVAEEEFKRKCSINRKSYDNLKHSPNKHDNINTSSNNGYTMKNGSLPDCNPCQQQGLSSENCRPAHVNPPLRSPSQNGCTSPFCNECDRNNRGGGDTLRNIESHSCNDRIYPRTKSNTSERPKRPDGIHLQESPSNGIHTSVTPNGFSSNGNIKSPVNSSAPMSKASDNLTNMSREPMLCIYCNKNQVMSPDTQYNSTKTNQSTSACLRCIRSWRRSIQHNISNNVSQNHFNGNSDTPLHSSSVTKTPIVIDVDNYSKDNYSKEKNKTDNIPKDNCETGLTNANPNIKSGESVSYTNSSIGENQSNKIPMMELVTVKREPDLEPDDNRTNNSNHNVLNGNTTNDDDFLDIDEKSFETFINNSRGEAESPLFDVNSFSDHNRNYESQVNELNRKRKSPFPILPLEKNEVFDQRSADDVKSIPTSPNFHINQEQLQILRNKVTPILKAKKWIRQSSLDTPTDESSGSFGSD